VVEECRKRVEHLAGGHRRQERARRWVRAPTRAYLKLKVRRRLPWDADGAEAAEPRRGEAAAGPGSSVAAAMALEPGSTAAQSSRGGLERPGRTEIRWPR